MHKKNKIGRIIVFSILGILIILVVIFAIVAMYLYFTADFRQPNIDVDLSRYELSTDTDTVKVCDNSTLYFNRYGLWEAYISGTSVERGSKYGILFKDLLEYQEDVFVNQIYKIIPSESRIKFLHKFIAIFNRDMAKYIPDEYREEIYAMSLSGANKYAMYGSSYIRQLNYHAAHDIGHAMQQYMLVGCSSFACWDNESETKNLIVGRNFDFYVGDDFAKNKVILFVEPDSGYRFASVSWPGMMGVLSGMNEKGLTVTINAAKGTIPISSAMPISLLARHILQYASNIEEAYKIAQQFSTFVSESLLIASANDGYAAIIEKTPKKTALYKSPNSRIICTNHYQSAEFAEDEYNVENILSSDSPYRYNRLNELLDNLSPISTDDAVAILRNRYGNNNSDIGLGNEKAINQFISHHSVVFQPEELKFWVSTSPWQLGEFVCYDLNNVFDTARNTTISYMLGEFNIVADSLALDDEYKRILRYREQYKTVVAAIENTSVITSDFVEEFIANNPNYFQVYNILGDYEVSRKNYTKAIEYWGKALSLEIPKTTDKDKITDKIKHYD